jgi:hypothetical protein
VYELNRIRLFNIGPRGARYDDVTLDLSGAGSPVDAAAFMPVPGQAVLRPAPASLLLLENGGGKSVLIRMLISTVLPERQYKRGREALRDYIAPSAAPAHVAAEWVHVRTGEMLVTGQILWMGGERVERKFYSLRPNFACSLETLPFAENAKRLTATAFLDALGRIDAQHKSLSLVVEDGQGAWERHLRELGLEPDLFAVQQAMNVDEGDAADPFKASTGGQFVDWFLRRATDAERYDELSDAYRAYARNVGRRDQDRLEYEFCSIMQTVTETLAASHEANQQAFQAAKTANAGVSGLSAQIHAAHARAVQASAAGAEELRTARELVRARRGLSAAGADRAKEVHRRTLLVRLADERREAGELSGRVKDTTTELAAWRSVSTVLDREQATEKYRQAAALLSGAEHAAGQAQLARDTAGADYAGALIAAENIALGEATTLDADAEGARREQEGASAEAGGLENEAGKCAGRAESLREAAAAAVDAIQTAREQGILGDDEEVGQARERLKATAGEAAEAVQNAKADLERRIIEAAKLVQAANDLIEPTLRKHAEVRRAQTTLDERMRAALALIEDDLVAEALELEPQDLLDGRLVMSLCEQRGSGAVEFAVKAETSAQSRLINLGLVLEADRARLKSLDAGEDALSAPREAVQAVLEILAEHEVTADTGWRALEQTTHPSKRAEAIQRNPASLDGIVVETEHDLTRAREILEKGRPHPAGAVFIGLSSSLLDAPEAEVPGFVVEPSPALYDPQAAAILREEIRTRVEENEREATDLQNRQRAAGHAATALRAWIAANPEGTANDLERKAAAAAKDAEIAQVKLDKARSTAEDANADAEAARLRVADLEPKAQTAHDDYEAFTTLADKYSNAQSQLKQALTAEKQGLGLAAKALTARSQATEFGRKASELAVQAEGRRNAAAAFSNRLKDVTHGSHAPVERERSDEEIAELARTYQAAAEVYQASEVDDDLRAAVQQAQDAISRANTELAKQDHTVRERSTTLAGRPGSNEPTIRASEIRRVERELAALTEAKDAAGKTAAGSEKELELASPDHGAVWCSLEQEWIPTTTEDGERLTLRAREAAQQAESDLADAQGKLTRAEGAHTQAGTRVADLKAVCDRLDFIAQPPEESEDSAAEPYPWSAEQAGLDADRVITQHRKAEKALTDCATQLRENLHEFRKQSQLTKFKTLSAPIYTQLVNFDLDQLPARATLWSAQLTERAASLTSELESAGKHRQVLLEQIKYHVDDALKLLNRAERLSALPESAGAWAGSRILRIGFARPDTATLGALAGSALDEHARTKPQLPGMDLVLRCMSATVPRGFNVSILKPDPTGQKEYVTVDRMGKIFSGGQELTGAIMLYCTLAAVRMSTRGQTRGSHLGGMLVLDNPIGKASADYLLELQKAMAAALGVQLIYTTGSMEDRVLASFPLCIRLRNSPDHRSGASYLRVTARTQANPDTEVDSDVHGTIAAARLFVKPTLASASTPSETES